MALAPPIRWVQPSTDPAAMPETARSGDWTELPAIERASGELELTAPSRAFALGLATRQTTRTMVAPPRPG